MLKYLKFYLICALIVSCSVSLKAQETGIDIDPILIRLRAQILSKGDSSPVPYANIINYRNRSGASANAIGHFSLEMLNIDTLVVSATGFKPATIRLPRFFSPENVLQVFMEPVVYPLGEVPVSAERLKVNMDGIPVGRMSDIPVELRGDAFNERPPVISALFNPLSYWQYYLSRREIQKRRVRKAVSLEKNWEMHSLNYNKEVVKLLTGLNENEADDFMVWFNAQNVLPYTATEYEVRSAIREYYLLYAFEKNMNRR